MKPLSFILVVSTLISVTFASGDCPSHCSCAEKSIQCENVDPTALSVLVDEVISILDGSTLDKLTIKRCTGSIKEFNLKFPAAMKVKSLEISSCGIEKIGNGVFDKLSGLEELHLPNNAFRVIPLLGKLNKLKALNLNKNRLTSLADGSLSGLDELTHLRLRHNNISTIRTTSLAEVKSHLVLLDLSHNSLTNVPAQNIRGAMKLTYLDLSYNKINLIQQLEFVNLIKLKELRLNNNKLGSLNPRSFMNVPSITHISLQENQLKEVLMLNTFEQLEFVNISFNALTRCPLFKDFSSLRQVILNGNKIQKIETMTFSSCPKLEVIDLRDNDIAVIARNSFDSLPEVKNVLLSENDLTSIPKGSLDGLNAVQSLSLANNTISEITKDSFTSVPNVTVLSLANNSIHEIPRDTFTSNTKLYWLDLSNNGLETIEDGSLPPKVGNILLNGNNLNCDNKFDWFVKYLVSNNVRTFLPEQPEVTCNSPEEFYGTRLKDLMIKKANHTLTQSMRQLGLDQNTQARNELMNRILPALGNFGGGTGGGGASPVLNSLSQALPALRNIPGLSMLPSPQPGSDPASRNLDSAVEQFAEPLVRLASGGQAVPSDINNFIKSIPNLVVNIPGVGDVDISKLPPSLIEHVLKGGQIPGVPKETLQGVVKQYMQRVYAAAAQAQGKQMDSDILQDVPNALNLDPKKYLKPLTELPSQFVTNVMKGEPLPFLTSNQTDVIKTFYTQGIPIEGKTGEEGTLAFTPNMLNMLKLLPPGYDWSKLPENVTKAVMRGELPNLADLPQELQNHIRDNLDSLIKSLGNTPDLSIDEIMKKLPNFTRPEDVETFAPYDINKIDADLVVKGTGDVETMRFYIAIALGMVSAITIVVLAVFCWYSRKQQEEGQSIHPAAGPLCSSTPRRPKLSCNEEEHLERGNPAFTEPLTSPRNSRLNDSSVYHRHNISSSHQYV
uniref:Leucine-rich repeat-containing protein 15 n=1 Tax=Bursaphelenchus xylophilus TaxID=6326 RepID=A0A1I7RY49_BURXY